MRNERRMKEVFAETAARFGISEAEVAMEIELAACAAIITAYRNNDQETIARWEKIPRQGIYPSAADIIEYCSDELSQMEAEG